MGMIPEEQAKSTLSAFHQAIFDCVDQAWDRWTNQHRKGIALPSRRFAANAMYELMIDEARRRLAPLPGVNIIETSQRFLVGIGGIVLRFKKLNDLLGTSNFPTQTSLLFDAQLALPGIPEGPRLTIGYRPDRFWTKLLDVVLVGSTGEKVEWSYSLMPVMAPVIQIPGTSRPEQEAAKRVKPKRALKKRDTVLQSD